MDAAQILARTAEIQAGLDEAAERLLDHLGRALPMAQTDALKTELVAALEACAFHDLAGQRLAVFAAALMGLAREAQDDALWADPLLNGPADRGQGLDQAAVDRLLSA
ncbi:hypothetical protein ASG17_01400 [Brevundimonas sp. Leaf363]|uniref:hypothetical protein n=1 Tax=Brevundimonas sp. Leaf363 TaxID=1736353 RepID=UPI0006FDD8C6|nr:hypothetical protein [Brevundimonas sp. Leaf363]KQS57408.1 hypothetical protein ASG17_01400 [Brevundimonas sp. Leaf363]